VQEFIVALCDRHVKQPSQVWERCVFADPPDQATVAPYRRRAEAFQQRFRDYLFGSGAPEVPPGQQPEEGPTDPTIPEDVLRSCTLIAALTESEDLPADPDYRIQVRIFAALRSLTYAPQFNWHYISEVTIPTLGIHTCTGTVDVFLTRELDDLMAGQNGASFDYWLHAQLLSSRGIYNQV